MTKENTDKAAVGSMAQKGLDLLERAWNWAWALRLVCAVMFLDAALVLRTGHGLWQWSQADMPLLKNVGWLALTFVAFCVAAALVLPAIIVLLRQIGAYACYKISSIISFTEPDGRPYQRSLGYVPARELRDLALREKDDFLHRLYEEHTRSRAADKASVEQAGNLTAAAVLASLLNWIIVHHWAPGCAGLIQAIYGVLGDAAVVITVIVLLCAGAIIKWAWFPPYEPDVIYYPPLDAELRQKERERRDDGI